MNEIEYRKKNDWLVVLDSLVSLIHGISTIVGHVMPNWFGFILWHFNHCRSFNAKSVFILAQLSGAVEYTDCISAEE